jgi:hypothetical protein
VIHGSAKSRKPGVTPSGKLPAAVLPDNKSIFFFDG